jgi:hypothetical protein
MTAPAMPTFDGTALFYVACQSHSGSFLGALSSSAPMIGALSKNAMPADVRNLFQRRQAVGVGIQKTWHSDKSQERVQEGSGVLIGVFELTARFSAKNRIRAFFDLVSVERPRHCDVDLQPPDSGPSY